MTSIADAHAPSAEAGNAAVKTVNHSSVSNRRSSKRMAVRTSVSIEVRKGALGLGANLAAQFLDISEGGVRVIVKSDIPQGSEVEVTLTGHGVRKTVKRCGVVCWSMKLESGQYAIGLHFDKRVSFAEVSAFARPS